MESKAPEEIKKEMDRYYRLIYLYLGLKWFIDDQENTDFRFIGSEIDIKRESGGELRPDIILQYESQDVLGFPIEIKRSLSDRTDVKDKLKDMTRYDEKLLGWDTEEEVVKDHFIVFAPHLFDSQRAINIFEESEDIVFEEKDFLIWEWGIEESMKYGESDVLLVRLVKGGLDIDDIIAEYLKDGIRINIDDNELVKAKEKTLFVRERPPIPYTVDVLWHFVLRGIKKEDNEYTITEVKKEIQSKYTSNLMQNVDGNPFQVRKSWLRNAFDCMVELNLAEKLSREKYKVNTDKNIKKNFQDFIAEKLGEEKDEAQTKL